MGVFQPREAVEFLVADAGYDHTQRGANQALQGDSYQKLEHRGDVVSGCLIATSQADASVSASAAVMLDPVAVSVAPVSVALIGGQTQQFTASVIGTTNT